MDGQVKVNGHRVEPAEVVASLEALDGIARAAVIHRAGQGSESGLVAFLVMEEGRVLDEIGLRAELSQRLPGHMLPVRCLTVDHIPLNPNGKVDRPLLLDWDDKGLEERAQRVRSGVLPKPDTPTETSLAALWSQILGIETIHADDSFFSLGGNSLQLIRLMDRIASIWGLAVDPSGIFIHPTLRAMARLLDDRSASIRLEGQGIHIHPVEAWDTGSGRHLFAMVGGAGSVSEFTKYHRIGFFLGEDWRVHILPDPDASHGRFPKMGPAQLAERYAELVLPVARREKVWLLGDCIGGVDAFALACELQSAGISELGLILLDASAPPPSQDRSPSAPLAADTFAAMPETGGRLTEAIHRRLIPMASRRWARWLLHLPPRSRRQAFRLASAWGLFDPDEYLSRVSEAGLTPEEAFRHYLTVGWREGVTPSSAFNAYLYRKILNEFQPGADEPVLHALLFGMRTPFVRQKIMEKISQPDPRSDIMAARTLLRREDFRPAVFRGDLHLVLSARIHDRGTDLGWGRFVTGSVRIHRVEGDHRSYLQEHLVHTAAMVRKILDEG